MSRKSPSSATIEPEVEPAGERYVLRLYITGSTPQSTRAVVNIRKICERYLSGRYELEVVNVAEHPALAAEEQIIAAPTLIKKLPLPLRRFIGDMSHTDRILVGLDVRTAASDPDSYSSVP